MSGPLDDLIGDAVQRTADVPVEPVHARVLEVDEPGEDSAWVLTCWRDPGGANALHVILRQRVEGTLLSELSSPAGALAERDRRWGSLRLALFDEVEGLGDAVRAFGLEPDTGDDATWRRAMAHLRGEAQALELDIHDTPAHTFTARFAQAPGMDEIESRLRRDTGGDFWGATPGAPFGRLAAALTAAGSATITPDLDGLSALEPLIVPADRGVIRWIPPMVFQGLCDLIGVVLERDFGKRPQWAVSEPDEMGLAPPPLLRLTDKGGHVHVPIAVEILRWCVMPAAHDETIPPLSHWLASSFR